MWKADPCRCRYECCDHVNQPPKGECSNTAVGAIIDIDRRMLVRTCEPCGKRAATHIAEEQPLTANEVLH